MQGQRVLVDGKQVSPDQVGPPAMNYGQLNRWGGFKRLEYEYELPVPEFVNRLDGWFESHREEVRADDERDPPEPGGPDAAFAAAGYPDLVELLGGYVELFEPYLVQFGLEINNAFGSRNSAGLRYAVNSVDWIRLEDGCVRFGGVAFDMQENRSDKRTSQ